MLFVYSALHGDPEDTPILHSEELHSWQWVGFRGRVGHTADLDNNRFAVREKASGELEQLGELAESVLRVVLEGKSPPETRERVKALLARRQAWFGDQLRRWCVIQVLEWVSMRESQSVLKTLAEGAPASRLTQEAQAALDRLSKTGNRVVFSQCRLASPLWLSFRLARSHRRNSFLSPIGIPHCFGSPGRENVFVRVSRKQRTKDILATWPHVYDSLQIGIGVVVEVFGFVQAWSIFPNRTGHVDVGCLELNHVLRSSAAQ